MTYYSRQFVANKKNKIYIFFNKEKYEKYKTEKCGKKIYKMYRIF